jgi:hypothetical protein
MKDFNPEGKKVKIILEEVPPDESLIIPTNGDIKHENENSGQYIDGVKIPDNIYEPRDIEVDGGKACSTWEEGLHTTGKPNELFSQELTDDPKEVDKMVEEYLKSLGKKNKDE